MYIGFNQFLLVSLTFFLGAERPVFSSFFLFLDDFLVFGLIF